jgi:hypothetical protein
MKKATREERRRVRLALLGPWLEWVNTVVADKCETTYQTVGWVRTEMEQAGEIPETPRRKYVAKNGEVGWIKTGKSNAKRGRPDAKSEAKAYWRGWWEAKADERNIDPRELHHVARQVRDNDRESKRELARMLREAREQLRHYGYNPLALGMHLAAGRVEDDVPALDVVADSMARTWPEFFNGHEEDAERRLLELLAASIPKGMSEADSYESALASLDRWRGGGYEAAA